MENNFREVKDDLMKEWLDFREDTELAYLTKEDKKLIFNLMRLVNVF